MSHLDRQRAAFTALMTEARHWWESRRPVGWDLREHLDNPTVNTATQWEAALARAVAEAVEVGAL